jgi:hypothetical protein
VSFYYVFLLCAFICAYLLCAVLVFENINDEEAEISILDEDAMGPPCLIGSAVIQVKDYMNKKKHVQLPLHLKGKEEAMLELDVLATDPGGAAGEVGVGNIEDAPPPRPDEIVDVNARGEKVAGEKEKAPATERGLTDRKAKADKVTGEKEKEGAAVLEKEKTAPVVQERKLSGPGFYLWLFFFLLYVSFLFFLLTLYCCCYC